MIASLLGLCTYAAAGELTISTVAFIGEDGWSNNDDGTTSVSCGAVASGTHTHDSDSRTGSIQIGLQYVGSATDVPPTSVLLIYNASLSGQASYSLLGRTPPHGSASASFDGSLARLGLPTVYKTGTIGPVSQTTVYQGSGVAPAATDVSNQTLSTLNWSYEDRPGGARVYSLSAVILVASGNATADCDVNWKSSHSMSLWDYTINSVGMQAVSN